MMMETLVSNLQGKTSPSPDLVESLVCDLKKRRCGKNPATLKNMSIRCVLENKARFLSDCVVALNPGHCNPLTKLPNLIVQDIIAKMLIDSAEMIMGKYVTMIDEGIKLKQRIRFTFLLHLLNPLIIKFNPDPFVQVGVSENATEHALFRHLLYNCPKIQQMEISRKMWEEHLVVPRSRPSDLIRVMACKWPNLTYLKLQNTLEEGSDYLLQVICRSFPKLVELEMALSLDTLTMKGVQHLSKMQKLETLGLDLAHSMRIGGRDGNQYLTVLVHAVGRIPSLQHFRFLNENSFHSHEVFVDTYGEFYAAKKLTIDKIRLSKDLSRRWPDCLSLKELHIESYGIDEVSCENFLAGNVSVKKMSCAGIAPVYSLVEKFGPAGLTHLVIKDGHYQAREEPLDVNRVLAACPSIEHVQIKSHYYRSNQDNSTNEDCLVPPENFKNCAFFSLTRGAGGHSPQADTELYMRYLLGSKKLLKTLRIESHGEFQVIWRVLDMKKPSCIDQVEKVTVEFENYFGTEMMIEVFKLALLLAERSPCLKIFELKGYDILRKRDLTPDWFLGIFERLGISVKDQYGAIRLCDRSQQCDDEDDVDDDDEEDPRGSDYDD